MQPTHGIKAPKDCNCGGGNKGTQSMGWVIEHYVAHSRLQGVGLPRSTIICNPDTGWRSITTEGMILVRS
jgi:hypothetical protein